MINRDYKSGKIIEIIREWDNTGDKYEINGIDKSLAVPFFRYEYEKFKVIPKGSYKYIAENNNEFLVITNPDILSNATQFQMVYVYSQESSKYIEDFPDISILKEKYNQLVEDTTNIFGYLKSVGLIADTEQMTQVLTQLRPLETWYMNAEGEIDSLPVSEFSEKLKEVIQKIYEDVLSKITVDYEELSKKLSTQTQEELAILQAKFETLEGLLDTFTKLKLTEISEFTQKKIEEIQKVCDELIAITTHKLDKVDTIEQLKQATWVKLGDVIEVLGYYSKDDGATHKRVISDVDDGSGVELANGLWANIVHNGEVNVSWFGAVGDGVTDDTLAFQKAIDLANTVELVGKIYAIKNLLLKSNLTILSSKGRSEILCLEECDFLVGSEQQVDYLRLVNIKINGNYKAKNSFKVKRLGNSKLEDLYICGANEKGILIPNGVIFCTFDFIEFLNNGKLNYTTDDIGNRGGMYIGGDDSTYSTVSVFSNLYFRGGYGTALDIKRAVNITIENFTVEYHNRVLSTRNANLDIRGIYSEVNGPSDFLLYSKQSWWLFSGAVRGLDLDRDLFSDWSGVSFKQIHKHTQLEAGGACRIPDLKSNRINPLGDDDLSIGDSIVDGESKAFKLGGIVSVVSKTLRENDVVNDKWFELFELSNDCKVLIQFGFFDLIRGWATFDVNSSNVINKFKNSSWTLFDQMKIEDNKLFVKPTSRLYGNKIRGNCIKFSDIKAKIKDNPDLSKDIATLNTPLMFARMEKRGVKEDYINYMDEKEKFEKLQAKILEEEEQQTNSNAKMLKLATIPLEEPKPSEKLQQFIDEFL